MEFNDIVNNFLNGNKIDGGLGDDLDPNDFDPKQVAKGIDVEMEHTDDPVISLEIVMDHLAEDPNYYDYLEDMEKEMKSDNKEEVEEAMTAGGTGGVFTAYSGTVDAGEHGGALKSTDWYNPGDARIPQGPGKAAVSAKDKKKDKKKKKKTEPKALLPITRRMFPNVK